jgi:hypothetical protein
MQYALARPRAFGSFAQPSVFRLLSFWQRGPRRLCGPSRRRPGFSLVPLASTTRSARGCHPCLRYDLSPMCPGEQRILERAKGFEPSTPTLARSCSTPELHPHPNSGRANGRPDHRAPMPKGRNLCNHPAGRFIGAPCPLSRAPPRCMKRAASRVASLANINRM